MHLTSVLGDPAVRHRGTIGGSLANNDPAADYPAAVLALGATVKTNKRVDTRRMISSRACSRPRSQDDEIITAVSFPIPAKAAYSKMRHPASRFALTGVFVVKTKAGDVRVAATGASQNGVMRVPAIEAALKANWSAGRARTASRSQPCRAVDGYPRLGGLPRQPGQGDGAARGRRRGLIAKPLTDTMRTARSDARRFAFGQIPVQRGLATRCPQGKSLFGHDLVRKPVSTFRDHALQRLQQETLGETTCSIKQRPALRTPHFGTARRLPGSSNSPASALGPFACMMLADMGAEVDHA